MSEKGGKKNTIKNNKKATKDKKPATLKLGDGKTVLAKSINKETTRVFNISDIDIDKIKVSDKKLYIKKHDSCKHYVFDEYDNEYIPLKITLLDVPGFYNIYNDNGKTMNFKFDDDSLEKIIDIFEHIGEKLNIDLDHYLHEDMNSHTYFKTKVSDYTGFRKNKDKTTNTISNEGTMCNCRTLLQIQSAYYNNKDKIEGIDYYRKVLLQHCRYTFFINDKVLHDALEFTDTEQRVNLKKENLMRICIKT